MKNTLILTGILFVAVVVASVYYFAGLDRDDQVKTRLYEQLPDDTAWIITFQNDELLDNVLDGFPIFKAILGGESIRKLNRIRHDLLGTNQLGISDAEQDLLISVHPVERDSLSYLISLVLKGTPNTETLYKQVQSISGDFSVSWSDTVSHSHFALSVNGFEKPLFVTIKNNIIMSSPSLTLIERLSNESYIPLPKNTIDYFIAANEKNSLLKLHVIQKNMGRIARRLTAGSPGTYLSLLDSIQGPASLHMNYKSDALILSGFSELNTSDQYLSLFTSESPVAQQVKHLFPANTATYLSFGISDFERFHRGNLALMEKSGRLSQMHDQHRIIEERNGVSIQEDLLPQWGNEFALVELANRENLAVFALRDTGSFRNIVDNISTSYPDSIYRFNNSNLLQYSFGEAVEALSRPYFMVLGDYLVCANHTSTLRQFHSDLSAGNTLSSTLGYRTFNEIQGNTSNISFFVHVENAHRIITGKLKSQFENLYTDTTQLGFSDFYAWSIQLSGNGNNFFTNIYAQYIDKASPGYTPKWAFDLEGRLAAPPSVFYYDDTSRFILAQSSSHILYAIDFKGNNLWNARLPSIVLGTPQQLKDGSIVLATESRLYRFDKNGEPLTGFSIELSATATAGATVIDKDGHVKIFVPSTDGLMVYDDYGELLTEWGNKTLKGTTVSDIKTSTTLKDTTLLVVVTETGQLHFLNEQGQTINSQPLVAGFSGGPAVVTTGDDMDELLVFVTDTLGYTRSYSMHGISEQYLTEPNPFATQIYTTNITGLDPPGLVYVEPRSVVSFRYPDSIYTFRYELGQDINLEGVQLIEVSKNNYAVGISTPANGLIYVIKGDGTLADGFPREGGPHFYYSGPSSRNPTFLLTSQNDRRLYLFEW